MANVWKLFWVLMLDEARAMEARPLQQLCGAAVLTQVAPAVLEVPESHLDEVKLRLHRHQQHQSARRRARCWSRLLAPPTGDESVFGPLQLPSTNWLHN